MSVHLTNKMLRGFMLLAIKEGWDEEEVDKRIEQFAIATKLNDKKPLDEKNILTLYREVRAKKIRSEMKVVGGTESPANND